MNCIKCGYGIDKKDSPFIGGVNVCGKCGTVHDQLGKPAKHNIKCDECHGNIEEICRYMTGTESYVCKKCGKLFDRTFKAIPVNRDGYITQKIRHENTYYNDERVKKELQDICDNIRELSSKYEFKFDKMDSILEGVKCTIEKHKDIICKQLIEDLGIDPKLYNVVYKISAGDDYKVKIEFDVVKKERIIKGIIDLDAEHPSLY